MKKLCLQQKRTDKIKTGRISYMNVAPVYYGFDCGFVKNNCISFIKEPPAKLNLLMEKNELKISPVSSAAYGRNMGKWLILPDLSISCFSTVKSVLLVSRYPLDQLSGKNVLFNSESETSVALLKLLFIWMGVCPVYSKKRFNKTDDIDKKVSAFLIIGDSALIGNWDFSFKYVYDLGDKWNQFTNLPFVFALWVVQKDFAEKNPDIVAKYIYLFKKSKKIGLSNLNTIAKKISEKLPINFEDGKSYYNKLNYDLDEIHLKGLEKFYESLLNEKIIQNRVELNFYLYTK